MLSKAKVLESIKDMPEHFNLDELFERLIFLQKIEIGMAQAAEGKVYSQEEVEQKVKSWRK